MSYTILGSRWWTNTTLAHLTGDLDTCACIGIVAIKTNEHEPDDVLQWKAYIGVTGGFHRQIDEQNVARLGTPLSAEEAAGFFPQLDVAKYKNG